MLFFLLYVYRLCTISVQPTNASSSNFSTIDRSSAKKLAEKNLSQRRFTIGITDGFGRVSSSVAFSVSFSQGGGGGDFSLSKSRRKVGYFSTLLTFRIGHAMQR